MVTMAAIGARSTNGVVVKAVATVIEVAAAAAALVVVAAAAAASAAAATGIADHGARDDERCTPPQCLHESECHQRADIGREGTSERTRHEQCETDEQWRPPTMPIREGTIHGLSESDPDEVDAETKLNR